MIKTVSALLLSASVFVSAPALAGTYLGSIELAGNMPGALQAQYSITTDGTLGNLTDANVSSWSVKLSGYVDQTFTSRTVGAGFVGSFVATDNGLFLGPNSALTFSGPVQNNSRSVLEFTGTSARIFINTTSLGVAEARGTVASQFANAVPEPASWAMMIAGFAMAAGALRRRRAPEQPAYA